MFLNETKMQPNTRTTLKLPGAALCLLLTACMVWQFAPNKQYSWAEDIDTNYEADATQAEVERSAAEYDEITSRVDELNALMAENEQQIPTLEANLPEQQQKSQAAFVKLYKTQANTPGLLSLILGSQTISDFLTSLEYISHIFTTNQAEINRLSGMKEQLANTKSELASQMNEASAKQTQAQDALERAQVARQEAQRRAQEEAARAQAEAEAAAQKQAEEQAAKQAEEAAKNSETNEAQTESTTQDSTSSTTTTEIATTTPDGADWSSDKATFVSGWASRIDAYLAGSPMAGTGTTFAEAAWDYGVDPRWSPAISTIESSKGAACFASHNAWGWGSESWGSWEDAIRDHVQGLARGYGYTNSVEAAKKYCPPNWEHWYNSVAAQMEKI